MAKITATGGTWLGTISVEITGNRKVESVKCNNPAVEDIIRHAIDNAEGWMANCYYPEAGTMLQAYAYLTNIFDYRAVKVVGDIGKMPKAKEGMLY